MSPRSNQSDRITAPSRLRSESPPRLALGGGLDPPHVALGVHAGSRRGVRDTRSPSGCGGAVGLRVGRLGGEAGHDAQDDDDLRSRPRRTAGRPERALPASRRPRGCASQASGGGGATSSARENAALPSGLTLSVDRRRGRRARRGGRPRIVPQAERRVEHPAGQRDRVEDHLQRSPCAGHPKDERPPCDGPPFSIEGESERQPARDRAATRPPRRAAARSASDRARTPGPFEESSSSSLPPEESSSLFISRSRTCPSPGPCARCPT